MYECCKNGPQLHRSPSWCSLVPIRELDLIHPPHIPALIPSEPGLFEIYEEEVKVTGQVPMPPPPILTGPAVMPPKSWEGLIAFPPLLPFFSLQLDILFLELSRRAGSLFFTFYSFAVPRGWEEGVRGQQSELGRPAGLGSLIRPGGGGGQLGLSSSSQAPGISRPRPAPFCTSLSLPASSGSREGLKGMSEWLRPPVLQPTWSPGFPAAG